MPNEIKVDGSGDKNCAPGAIRTFFAHFRKEEIGTVLDIALRYVIVGRASATS
jgi:hypothetical protein